MTLQMKKMGKKKSQKFSAPALPMRIALDIVSISVKLKWMISFNFKHVQGISKSSVLGKI